MVTEIRRSFRPDQLVTAEVSLVEAFGVDDAPGKVIHRDSCYATECREHVDVRQLRSLDDRILTVRGLVSREASFSCDPAFACGLMPGDVVTLTGSEP
jgi:hypothetical protein